MRIHKWLLPASALYGMGVRLRNWLFEENILKSKSYREPVICLGNLTAGGTGKTPHTEYLIKLLQQNWKVGVLSRGYKRKSKGWVLADTVTPSEMIGDEPWQMKHKFPETTVAVCEKRVIGIDHMLQLPTGQRPQVILLDDAYQHRYVKAGISILLTRYNRLICDDRLLPAGRLREPFEERLRASIVIVTKCPTDIQPIDFRIVRNKLDLLPYQHLYFTTLQYIDLRGVFHSRQLPLTALSGAKSILLVTGIATPKLLAQELRRWNQHIDRLAYLDHHNFTDEDIERINRQAERHDLIVTTEKDAARLCFYQELSEHVKQHLFALRIEVHFLQDKGPEFDKIITDYVRRRNSILRMA